MADGTKVLTAGDLALRDRLITTTPERVTRRLRVDRLTRRLVKLGGVAIIASILAILIVIVAEVYPLLKKPTATLVGTIAASSGSPPLAVGVDEYREIAYLVTASGVQFLSIKDGTSLTPSSLAGLKGAMVAGTSPPRRGPFVLGLSDGRVIPAEVKFSVSYPERRRRVEAELAVGDPIVADPDRRPITRLARVVAPAGPIIAAAVGPKELVLLTVKETKALIGPSTKEESRQRLSLPIEGEITGLALDGRGEDLLVGTSSGQVLRVDLREP
ncbi:MAG: ABC transporter permease subunit, partial [Candidatus Methylomirabilis sp.]